MIEVEKMNSQKIFLNPDLILSLEVAPDTILTFSNGDKLLLKTSPDVVVERIIEFRRKVASALPEIKK
jgi:flagellar protein FlbD